MFSTFKFLLFKIFSYREACIYVLVFPSKLRRERRAHSISYDVDRRVTNLCVRSQHRQENTEECDGGWIFAQDNPKLEEVFPRICGYTTQREAYRTENKWWNTEVRNLHYFTTPYSVLQKLVFNLPTSHNFTNFIVTALMNRTWLA